MSTIRDRWVAWKSFCSHPMMRRTVEFAPSHPTTYEPLMRISRSLLTFRRPTSTASSVSSSETSC